jgi:RsiW-degrading membrane proteinase PrsW (M82 family)
VEDGSLAGREFDLEGGALTIGRDEGCGVPLVGDTGVSRRHAEVRAEGGRFVVADLRSTNGTLVNGALVTSEALRSGDVIKLGHDGPSLRVELDAEADAAAPPPEPAQPEPSPEPTLPGRPRASLLDTGLYDPTKDKGQTSNVVGVVAVFGMAMAGLFFGLLVVLLTLFSLGPGAALVGTFVAFAPAPFYMLIWLWLDRNDPEPAWILAGTFLWGAGAATFASGIVNDIVGSVATSMTQSRAMGAFLSASVSAPLIEEATKALAVLLVFLFLRREFDGVLDGIVYAGIVALGFATVENVLYYGRAVHKEGVGGLIFVFILRGVLGPFGHAVYTSMTGIGLGLARQTHNTAVKFIAPVAGYFGAVFLHSLWNTLAGVAGGAFLIFYVIFWMPLFLAFFGVVIWMGQRESKLIRRMLNFEVARGLITAEQADVVSSWMRRMGWLMGSMSDRPRFQARRRFAHAATRLALCYWHVERAQAAGGVTLSFTQLPQFQKEIKKLREAV